jgi:hypothetical protein
MTCGTAYDNFLGDKDDIPACLGNGSRPRAVSFGRLENLFSSFPAIERNSRGGMSYAEQCQSPQCACRQLCARGSHSVSDDSC